MDFKGMTWAGNIYQKFEAMCLEVEEAMYQDTVKYVENQVQKVGISVKKFYSEVMEDLLPPSCVDPMNLAPGDLSLSPYGHTDVNKKPIPSIFDSHHDLKKKENEDQVISDVTAEKESSLSGYCDINSVSPQSPGIWVQNKCFESHAATGKKVGVHRRPVGINRISKNNNPSRDSCHTTSLSISGDRRSKLASNDKRQCARLASNDINTMSSSDLDVSREPGEAVKGNAPIPDTPIESPASDKILSAEYARENKDDSDCVSPASDKILSAESMRQNKDDSDCISPASDKILSAESVRQNKDDSDCISSASDKILSAESMRQSKDDSDCVSPASDKILSAESVRQNKDDYDCISSASDKILSAESVRQNKDDSDCISYVSDKTLLAEAVSQNKEDINCISSASDNNLSAASVRLKGDSKSTSACCGLSTESTDTSVNDASCSIPGSRIRSEACNLESKGKGVMLSNEGTSMKDGSSSIIATSCNAESSDKQIIMTIEDSFDMEVIENEEVAEPTVENFEREKLEESCVMVEGGELHCVPQGTRKHKSYKKKIREALSSKLRSRKDDQCVSHHKNSGEKNNAETAIPVLATDSKKQKAPADDASESDWELL